MNISVTDVLTGIIANPTSGQGASIGSWVLPYTSLGSGSQAGTGAAVTSTYTNPEE